MIGSSADAESKRSKFGGLRYTNHPNPLPYPGDWRGAQEAIVENDTDGLWGRWEITPHDLHNAPSYSSDAHAPADPVKAEMLATLKAADRRLHDLGYSVTDPVTQQICAAIALAEGRA